MTRWRQALPVLWIAGAAALLSACVSDEIIRLRNDSASLAAYNDCKDRSRRMGPNYFKEEGICFTTIPHSRFDTATRQPGAYAPLPPGCVLLATDTRGEGIRLVYSCDRDEDIQRPLELSGVR